MNYLQITGSLRDEIARILVIVAKDGLPEPRDLDVAIDAIANVIEGTPIQKVDDLGVIFWIGADEDATDAFGFGTDVTPGIFIPQDEPS